ncbi:MAG: ribonuclease Z [Desulfobacteraceae bacterium]|jgi:ribonuclease BN (tRNA processing enzyme)
MTTTKITILGSGTCVPRLDRSACAALIETGAAKILLDLGPGTIHRMLEYGVTIFDVTHIAFSHFHPDHTSEFVSLVFATKYPDGPYRKKALTVLGGQGLKAFYKGLQGVYGEWIVLPKGQMIIQELDVLEGETRTFADFKLTARPVNHRPESLAYRLEDRNGRVIVYSGDTDECDSLADLARDADIFICESAMPDQAKGPGHLTPSMAGKIATDARAKRLVLTHFYPPCDEVDVVKQAGSAYKGKIYAAEDLMSFSF